jgi:hypothetical protein
MIARKSTPAEPIDASSIPAIAAMAAKSSSISAVTLQTKLSGDVRSRRFRALLDRRAAVGVEDAHSLA